MVVLGVVKEGMVRAYDELALAPGGKKILVKSIQDA
jgi:selenocysteine-specific translation elongation factor